MTNSILLWLWGHCGYSVHKAWLCTHSKAPEVYSIYRGRETEIIRLLSHMYAAWVLTNFPQLSLERLPKAFVEYCRNPPAPQNSHEAFLYKITADVAHDAHLHSFIWTDDSVLVCLCSSVIRNELKLVYNLFVWHVAVVVCHSQPFLLCWNGESAHIIRVRWCRESTRERD